jgi:hypothetical protein
MDKTVKLLPDLTAEDFYGDKDSIYLRCTYIRDQGGFKVLIFNQIANEDMDENVVKMAVLVRGLAEVALESPTEVYAVGYEAVMQDQVHLADHLTDDEKDLLSNPVGNA